MHVCSISEFHLMKGITCRSSASITSHSPDAPPFIVPPSTSRHRRPNLKVRIRPHLLQNLHHRAANGVVALHQSHAHLHELLYGILDLTWFQLGEEGRATERFEVVRQINAQGRRRGHALTITDPSSPAPS